MRQYGKKSWFTLMCVIVSAFLQTYVMQAMIEPANLLSGGVTGLAILLHRMAARIHVPFSTSLGILLLNIPLALLCYRKLSRRFALFSSLQFLLTSVFLQIFAFPPLFRDRLLQVLFGGFLYGMSAVIALKGNASTGGTDFIALYVSHRTGKSIWSMVFLGNTILIIIFGLQFGWLAAGYSIIFQYIITRTISMFYHRYERLLLEIMTTYPHRVVNGYTMQVKHGITILPGIGGYAQKRIYVLHTVVSAYEVYDIVSLIKKTDANALINVIKSEQFYGNFYQKPME